MPDTTKKTIIVFSGDYDRIMAALIIANGALAMGDDVTMFFTFWGLNALRKENKIKVHKKPLQRMFGMMMPRGINKLGMSKMNFCGMGPKMMDMVVKGEGGMLLPQLLDSAIEQGVKIVACTLSMDMLGFKKEELLDGIDYVGVAAYLAEADEANVNLFI